MVAAASFDDAIAITGYTLFINLAVRSGGNTTWSVMHGPLSLIFGVIAGVIAGFMCSITKLWDNSFKRTLVMFFTSASHSIASHLQTALLSGWLCWPLGLTVQPAGASVLLIVLSVCTRSSAAINQSCSVHV